MARTPNPSLKNLHTLYISKSGGGKSQAMRQNPENLKPGRHLYWDESRDQRLPGLLYFNDKVRFVECLDKSLNQKYFRIGWDGIRDKKTFEWWCQVVWAIADGNKKTCLWIEELSKVNNSGEASPAHALILNEGRKYGLIHNATTQRPQEISKTVYDNTTQYFIGQQKRANVEKFVVELDLSRNELSALRPMEFYKYDDNIGDHAKKIKINYKKLPPF